MKADPRKDPEFVALRRLSATLGRDPLKTQAAGGNTSLKRDGILWIKASGTWLAEAEDRDIMVPVEIDPLLKAVEADDPRAEKATDFVSAALAANALRPSVETSVHAVIPARVVVHIHCVATVAVAVRTDAEQVLAQHLGNVPGVDWVFIPYVKPGVPLSRAIAAKLAPTTNVIVLGNHGLVVAADTVEEAELLLSRVATALETSPRKGTAPDLPALGRLAAGTPYRLPGDPVAHMVATEPASLAIARLGTLYPDHVVFLGPGITVLDEQDTPAALARRPGRPPAMLVLPGKGVLLLDTALRGADELARGLADVTARIPPDAPVQCLTGAQEDELVQWDAEVYRLKLAAEGRGGPSSAA